MSYWFLTSSPTLHIHSDICYVLFKKHKCVFKACQYPCSWCLLGGRCQTGWRWRKPMASWLLQPCRGLCRIALCQRAACSSCFHISKKCFQNGLHLPILFVTMFCFYIQFIVIRSKTERSSGRLWDTAGPIIYLIWVWIRSVLSISLHIR